MPLNATHTRASITSDFERHVSSGKVAFYRQAGVDLIIGKREGIHLYDLDGRQLINCHCNGGVFNLGHRNPRVISALRAALEELDIGNHHLVSEARARLGQRLAELSPPGINRVVYGVSGGEAVDTAIKLARGHTRRQKIISAQGGYHGHTGFALAAGDEQYKRPFAPLPPGFLHVPFGNIEALEQAIDQDTAAVLLETIPATLGIVIPPEGYFSAVRKLCKRYGALMIMDEVQTGLGRCGAVWAIETYGVEPDIIVTGKGLSGGIYPITATLYRDELNPFLHENPFIHISTFGGSELGCRTALEVLNILSEPGFLDHVNRVAAIFEEGFQNLLETHAGLLVETRQRGLMMGLKMANEMCGPLMSRLGLEAGIFTVYANNDPSVLQLLPPLIIQESEAQRVLVALDLMLSHLREQVASV
jgi:acetylornithine/succinyldiaminopimelate/putrescine aminotransferase